MKTLGTITYSGVNFDDVLLVVMMQFNELKRSNRTLEYKDIDVTHKIFNRYYVVLVYEYDDQLFGIPDIDPDPDTNDAEAVSKYIGIPGNIDPSDPNWREKLQTYNDRKGA